MKINIAVPGKTFEKGVINMKIKALMTITMVLFFTNSALCKDKYSEAKEQIEKWNNIMIEYTAKLDKSVELTSVGEICEALAKEIEAITPEMKEISKKYPELGGKTPPAEMKSFMEKHFEILEKFDKQMTKLMHLANKHSENELFQKAFGKLNMALYKMKR